MMASCSGEKQLWPVVNRNGTVGETSVDDMRITSVESPEPVLPIQSERRSLVELVGDPLPIVGMHPSSPVSKLVLPYHTVWSAAGDNAAPFRVRDFRPLLFLAFSEKTTQSSRSLRDAGPTSRAIDVSTTRQRQLAAVTMPSVCSSRMLPDAEMEIELRARGHSLSI